MRTLFAVLFVCTVATGAPGASTVWLGSSGSADAPGPRAGSAFLFRHDGTTLESPAGYKSHTPARTWASGANDVWFMMADNTTGPAEIVRWDGASFVTMAIPERNTVEIGGSSPTDVWVAGSNLVYHYGGPATP